MIMIHFFSNKQKQSITKELRGSLGGCTFYYSSVEMW